MSSFRSFIIPRAQDLGRTRRWGNPPPIIVPSSLPLLRVILLGIGTVLRRNSDARSFVLLRLINLSSYSSPFCSPPCCFSHLFPAQPTVVVLCADERAGGQDSPDSFFLVAVRDTQARVPSRAAVLPGQQRAGGAHLVVRRQASDSFVKLNFHGMFAVTICGVFCRNCVLS